MKKLVFKLDYAGKILSGEKTTTIRLSTDLNEGDVVEVYVGHVMIGKAVIRRIYKKRLSELSEEEVKLDGFKTKEDLVKALAKIYGSRRVGSDPEVYIIEFRIL